MKKELKCIIQYLQDTENVANRGLKFPTIFEKSSNIWVHFSLSVTQNETFDLNVIQKRTNRTVAACI